MVIMRFCSYADFEDFLSIILYLTDFMADGLFSVWQSDITKTKNIVLYEQKKKVFTRTNVIAEY